jgi:phosphoserine phosphatase RsbU/P
MAPKTNKGESRSQRQGSISARSRQELMDRALSAAAEGIVIVDAIAPGLPLVYINRGFESITGYSAEEVIGRNCRFLQGPETDPATVERLRSALREHRTITVEILNYRKDGSRFWNRLSITPVLNRSGMVTHFIGVQSDISEQKNTEEALRAAKEDLEKAGESVRRDLQAAARIQSTLLPLTLPEPEGIRFSWVFRPSAELAGDTLDIFWIDPDHVALYVLDVSGHGVSAALLSVTLSHWLSTIPGQTTLLMRDTESRTGYRIARPVEVATKLNQQFPLDTRTSQYFTLVYGLLNVRTRELRYVSAGHPPLIHLPAGKPPRPLVVYGFPIGLFADAEFEEQVLQLNRGDQLLAFTDGLMEAAAPDGQELGVERLSEILVKNRELDVHAFLTAVLREVEMWRGGEPSFDDDVTALALEVLE